MRRLPTLARPLALAACLALSASGAGRATSPWEFVAGARDQLAAAPRVADFTQTFVPAGFTVGESESGTVALALPDLARWDYRDPFPRTFLVQGETVFTWNEGETTGRRFPLAAEDAEHLALLRLDVEELARHYEATLHDAAESEVEIRLAPSRADHRLAEVSLTLRRSDSLPLALAYRDAEGNTTRFAFAEFRPLEGADAFLPPADLEWLAP